MSTVTLNEDGTEDAVDSMMVLILIWPMILMTITAMAIQMNIN